MEKTNNCTLFIQQLITIAYLGHEGEMSVQKLCPTPLQVRRGYLSNFCQQLQTRNLSTQQWKADYRLIH